MKDYLFRLLDRVLRFLGLRRPSSEVRAALDLTSPVLVLPPALVGTAAPAVFGAVGPRGSTGYQWAGPTGATGATGAVLNTGSSAEHMYPKDSKDHASATLFVDKEVNVEFVSYSYSNRPSDVVSITSLVEIHLVVRGLKYFISSVPALSPNSRASSVPWVASVIETKLAELGVKHTPLDLDLLEAASKAAVKASMESSLQVFSNYLVGRIEKGRAMEIWDETTIRYVMES